MSKKIKILLIDTDLDALSRLYLNLLHKGYRAEATNNTQEILPRMGRFKPDLIIFALPAGEIPTDSLELIRKKRIPVLFITHADGGAQAAGLKKFEVIPAPYSMNAIDQKIREMFNLLL